MKRFNPAINEDYRTMIIGCLPMNGGYKLLWQDNLFLEDLCDLEIYVDGNEYLQDYIYSCFRNTYDGCNFSKLYVVSISSKVENMWGKTKDMINCINPVGRIDMDPQKNKYCCQDLSCIDRDKINYDIDLMNCR